MQRKIIWGLPQLQPQNQYGSDANEEIYPAHELSRIPELWTRTQTRIWVPARTNKNRDNNLKLGAKNPEGFIGTKNPEGRDSAHAEPESKRIQNPGLIRESRKNRKKKSLNGGWGLYNLSLFFDKWTRHSIYSDKSVTKKGRNITVIIAVIMTPINNNNWLTDLIH